jgi:hypothetical protein
MSFCPQGDVQPKLTWTDAVAAFQAVDPEFSLPADASAQLGLYTAAVGDGTYRQLDRLAWGISWHACGVPAHAVPTPIAQPCREWLFLDANTGMMVESMYETYP